jgi:hypothetical protein
MNAKASIDIPPEIIERLKAVGETSATALWDCHGNWIIKHKALEKIAANAGITYSDCTVYPPQQGQEYFAVSLVGHLGDRSEWSIGEASPKNSKNNYYFAMAEKRAKDRVILKLLGLHAYIYSEEEADEFKEAAPSGENFTLKHINCVRDNWGTVSRIKVGIRDGKLDMAAEALYELSEEQDDLLNMAPSKGGVFTTEEREICFKAHGEVRKLVNEMKKADGEANE